MSLAITQVCSLYAPHVGGIETMIDEMSHHYIQEGHQPSVITNSWPADAEMAGSEEVNGITVVRVTPENNSRALPGTDNLSVTATSFGERLATLPRPDVLHIIGVRRPLPLFAVMAARHLDIPVIATVAGSEVPDYSDPSIANIWDRGKILLVPLYPQFDAVYAVSDAIAKNTVQAVPDIEHVPVLPAGIDTAAYEAMPASERFPNKGYILALRRLVHSKGIDILLRGFAESTKHKHDLELIIAGDGPERASLEQLSIDLGISNRVRFIGTVALSEGIGLMKSAAMTVVPSRSEGGGLVNTEANAVGCPLIVTDVGGIREYTSDSSARIVRPESPKAIAQAIIDTIRDEHDTQARVEQGKLFAQTLDWKVLIKRYVELYEQHIEQYKTRPFTSWSEDISDLNRLVQKGLL